MVSFIVIGKNEGVFLANCFGSIQNITNANISLEYEIIYVDSESSDNSIEIASQFEIRIILLTGEVSAGIARNVGAAESKGDILIFMDGDMEIQKSFFQLIFDSKGNLNFPYVSGDLLNIYFDSSFNFVNEGYFYKSKLQHDVFLPYTGGFFCIQKEIWLSVGGMREKYRINEDLDFGLRLSKKGSFILRKRELAIKHNTVSYFEKKRMKNILLKNDFGYRAVLFRDHLLNKNMYKILLRKEYSFLLLFIVFLTSSFWWHFELLFLYLFVIVTRSLFQSSTDKISHFRKMLFLIIKDTQMLFSFFFFFPKKKKSFTYQILKE
jgi:glycosyltransferase involved in cell wall biosynthesis